MAGTQSGSKPEKDLQESAENGYWEDRPNTLARILKAARRGLFGPATCSDPMPTPAEYVDVRRTTVTNLETEDEKSIEDIWDGTVEARRTLSDWCVGETRFLKLWRARRGFDVVDGGLTRCQKTSRPPYVCRSDRVGRPLARLRRGLIVRTRGIAVAP
jgi:hypothetical protein